MNGPSSKLPSFSEGDFTPFKIVKDPSILVPILEKRLPKSALIHNAALIYPRYEAKGTVRFYTLYDEIDESTWIIFLNFREDYGIDILVSADEEKSKISKEEAIEIFSATKIINWEDSYFFAALETWIANLMFEVSVNRKGNVTRVHPCYLFYKEREDCLKLQVPEMEKGVEVRDLDPELGLDFILKTWKYATKGSDIVIRNVLQLNESGAVYVDGKPVCGVLTQAFGMLSALYTLPEHRKKGYAILAMERAYKEQAKNGLVPASTVEIRNPGSITLHEKLGCKIATKVTYVYYLNTGF